MRSIIFAGVGSVLAVGAAQAVQGHYVGKGSEPAGYQWDLDAKVSPAGRGRYKIQVTSTNANCASQTDGVGTLRGKVLKVSGSCPLTIRFRGQSARIVEGKGCVDHGATCTFSGTLRAER